MLHKKQTYKSISNIQTQQTPGGRDDTNQGWTVVSGNLPAAVEHLTNDGIVRLLGY